MQLEHHVAHFLCMKAFEIVNENEIQDDIENAGVKNLGLSCWLSTNLQMLFHTDFRQEMIDKDMTDINDTYTIAVKSVLEDMKNGTIANPSNLLDILELHDSAEDTIEKWKYMLDMLKESNLKVEVAKSFFVGIESKLTFIFGKPPYCQKIRNLTLV